MLVKSEALEPNIADRKKKKENKPPPKNINPIKRENFFLPRFRSYTHKSVYFHKYFLMNDR